MQYPQAPIKAYTNPYGQAGQAVSKFGADVDEQQKLRQAFDAMVEARKEKAIADNRSQEELRLKTEEGARKETEAKAKTDRDKRRSGLFANAPKPVGPDGKPGGLSEIQLQQALTNGDIDANEYKALLPKGPDRFAAGGGYYELPPHSAPGTKPTQLVAPKPEGFAGLTRAQISTENNLRGQNNSVTKDYDIAKRAAQAFQSDYDEYRKMISSGNKETIKVAQQGMLDKYITASTNKSTGDAQFKNFMGNQGLNASIDNLYDKIVNGSMAPDAAIKTMRDITMSTAMKALQKTKQANAASTGMAESTNKAHDFSIDPASVVVHPPEMLSQDSVGFAQPSFDNTKPQNETKVFRGVTYELTPGKPRNDPKNWVPVKHE